MVWFCLVLFCSVLFCLGEGEEGVSWDMFLRINVIRLDMPKGEKKQHGGERN